MTKNKAIVVGLVTIWPILYMVFFMMSMFSMTSVGGSHSGFSLIFKLHLATMIHLYCMIGGYIYYIVKTNIVPQNKKTLWAVIIFLGNMVALPIFWYVYIWKPLNKPIQDNVLPNIFPWITVTTLLVFCAIFIFKSPFPDMETNDIYNLAIRDDGLKLQELLQEDPGLANAIRERDKWTPLHGAACNGNLKTVEILINSNADVNVSNINHNTPLHCAVQDNHIEITALLLEAGANPNIIGRKNKSPLDWAVWNENSEMADLLRKFGAKLSTDM